MNRLVAIVSVALVLGLALPPAATAGKRVDIEGISRTVLDTEIDPLLARLQTPPADDQLPPFFSDAIYVEPGTDAEGVLTPSDLVGSAGSASYTMTWAPPRAGLAVRFATVNYVFFDTVITPRDLEDFKSGAEEGLVSEEIQVDTIELEGADAVLLTFVLQDEVVQSVVQMVALPVGNCMVIAMLVEAGTSVDERVLQTAAEDLVLASASYLGSVAEAGSAGPARGTASPTPSQKTRDRSARPGHPASSPSRSTPGSNLMPGKTWADGTWEVTVTGHELSPTIDSAYRQDAARGVYVIVYLDVTNTGHDPIPFPYRDLMLTDAEGRRFQYDSDALFNLTYALLDVGAPNLEKFQPGLTYSTGVVFDIPAIATGLMKLTNTDEAFSIPLD